MYISRRLWLSFALLGFIALGGRPDAQAPQATLHIVGDLPGGGTLSVVRDATRVGGVIHASGGSVTRATCSTPPCAADTGFFWRSDTGAMVALPDVDPFPTAVAGLTTGFGISTSNGRYIASQARASNGSGGIAFRAVRVDTLSLGSSLANTNLHTMSPAFPITANTVALAVSDDGRYLHGNRQSGGQRAVRFDTLAQTNTLIPLVNRGGTLDTTNTVALRHGASEDGDAVVGTSFNTANNAWAFHYRHSTGILTAIPRLNGGLFNNAVTVSPNGNLVLVSGHNPSQGTVEVYLWNAVNNQIQELGTPNGASSWAPGTNVCANGGCNAGRALLAGMTPDGSVVAMTFGSVLSPGDGQTAYFRNQHGWFHLASALKAAGLNMAAAGWNVTSLSIGGMSSDATLIFGAGAYKPAGASQEFVTGFAVEFPAGFLAAYDPQPAPPVNTSLVGAWQFLNNPGEPPSSDPEAMVVFTADGVYYHIEQEPGGPEFGFERGFYRYDGNSAEITTLFDNNGTTGLSDMNGQVFSGTSVVGDTLVDNGEVVAYRVGGSRGSVVGAWVGGNPTQPQNSFVIVLTDDDSFEADDNDEHPDADVGKYSWNPITHEVLDTTGPTPKPQGFAGLSADGRTLHVTGDNNGTPVHVDLVRVIDPATVPAITSALSATATVGYPFSYQVTSTNSPTSFEAVGLPAGLGIQSGLISGEPSTAASASISLFAWRGPVAGTATLSLVTVAPVITPTGNNVVVTPTVPEGAAPVPVTIEFEAVTGGGETAVITIDPDTVADEQAPPAGFALGDPPVYYEIETTATFTGPVEVCFGYAGVTFSGFPRLLHYDEALDTWVDITTTVDTTNQIICGLTSSFSPFVMVSTAFNGMGFHRPIKPIAGDINTVKGGSTVALKFNVFGEGNVEITNTDDIDNLDFEVSPINCQGGKPEDWTPITTTGNTSLRYDTAAGHFVQNWKTPATPGCYLARVTGDGLLLSALFSVK